MAREGGRESPWLAVDQCDLLLNKDEPHWVCLADAFRATHLLEAP